MEDSVKGLQDWNACEIIKRTAVIITSNRGIPSDEKQV